MDIPYTLIRSRRRSIALQIRGSSGELTVRAPIWSSLQRIESFIESKRHWIEKHQERIRNRTHELGDRRGKVYTEDEIEFMKSVLVGYVKDRIKELGNGKNLPKIRSIKITKSESRWGSCSGKNALCFSYRLALYLDSPIRKRFIDAIIYHELAHLREKNHQPSFWNLVYQWMPEYREITKQFIRGHADIEA